MFINNQYLFNQFLDYRYRDIMESQYFDLMRYDADADTLWTLLIGA